MSSKLISVLLTCIFLPALCYGLFLNLGHLMVPFMDMNQIGKYSQIPLALIPLIGGVFGLSNVRRWGGLKSVLGKAIAFLSMSMIMWGMAMVCWLVYIFILDQSEVPYPSIADYAFFVWVQPLSAVGNVYLSMAIGTKHGIRDSKGKWTLCVVAAASVIISYILLFSIARGGVIDWSYEPLHLFFDFYYPIGTAVSLSVISIMYVLSRRYIGGRYVTAIYLLMSGHILGYIGDFWYSFANNNGTYFNGHWSDMFFLGFLYLVSLSISKIIPDV